MTNQRPQNVPPGDVDSLDRRAILRAGLGIGGMFVLASCGQRRVADALPGPVWPDQEAHPATLIGGGANRPFQHTLVDSPTVVASAAPGIAVMPRTAWTNAQPRWGLSRPMNGITRITVHHDALVVRGERGAAFAADRLNRIRRSHLDRGANWVDIGYHYIIDPDGRVWEGRPISIEGAHVSETNDHNLGVMCMGNFDVQTPTPAHSTTAVASLPSPARQWIRLFSIT